jgi:small subunit ribosomal protein S1
MTEQENKAVELNEGVEQQEKVAKKGTSKSKSKAKDVKTVVEYATPSADFDWENTRNDGGFYQQSTYVEFEKMYDQTLSTIAENEVIDGTVVSLNKREVVINIGYKSEGVVSLNEFRYNPKLKVGDKVEVYVETQEDRDGQLILSHKKARALRSWDRVNEALEKDEIIRDTLNAALKVV